MKLVNETTEESFEELRERAIIKYKSRAMGDVRFYTLMIAFASYSLYLCRDAELKGIWEFVAPVALIGCLIVSLVILILGVVGIIKYYRIQKGQLVDVKEKIIEKDENVDRYIYNTEIYAKLEKMKILEYSYDERNVVLKCKNDKGDIEEIKIHAEIEKQEDIKVPVLTLTRDDFVLSIPAFVKC